jgi:NAD(P)H-hydrate epimerase
MTVGFPPVRPFANGDVWALTADEASSFDAHAIQAHGIAQDVLMENAGRAAAQILARLYPGASVLGLVGPGNNGGDALVALRVLSTWGHSVRGVLVADRDLDDPLLHGWMLDLVAGIDLDDEGWDSAFASADVVLDGILGTGVRGEPRERQAAAIDRVNASGRPVLSLDVPSGIDATSGEVPGAAVRASVTISFGAPKLGSMLHPARALAGRQVSAEIGFPPMTEDDVSVRVVTPAWARARLPVREADTHKNQVGRVLIVGGQVGMAGAVILAARAAFHTGAGLVRICSAPENREAVQAAVPEAMFLSDTDVDALQDALHASDAVAVGPGLGVDERAAATLGAVSAAGGAALLLDADALNLAATGAVDLAVMSESRPVLITPHPGEMARLLDSPDQGQGRISTVEAAVNRFGCAVLFKGAPSLVAGTDSPVSIDTQTSSDLAVAGMGDTLSGVCVALMAQGLDPATAGSVGLYLSGRAAKVAGRGAGLTPSDVIRWLPEALTETGMGSSDLDLPFVTFDADAAR